jgi:hypothetical protein
MAELTLTDIQRIRADIEKQHLCNSDVSGYPLTNIYISVNNAKALLSLAERWLTWEPMLERLKATYESGTSISCKDDCPYDSIMFLKMLGVSENAAATYGVQLDEE